MTGISAIIITHNESAHLPICLGSLDWVDEIVVVDSGSTDDTVSIAQRHGAIVVESTDWRGFGPQKNHALAQASQEWVLSIDADEHVSPALRDAIRAVVADGTPAAYQLPRLSFFCGKAMRHSGWWPDHVLRLFPRTAGRFSDDLVHERVLTALPVRTLAEPLLHDTYSSLEEVVEKMNRYSSAGAQQAYAQGKRGGLASAVAHGLWTFLRTYVMKLGFLDGRAGLMLAISNAETSYYKYVKLFLLSRQNRDRA